MLRDLSLHTALLNLINMEHYLISVELILLLAVTNKCGPTYNGYRTRKYCGVVLSKVIVHYTDFASVGRGRSRRGVLSQVLK